MATLKKTDKTDTPNTERRRFLRLLGVGGTAMAVGQAPFTQAAIVEQARANVQQSTPEIPRYRETDHIRAFYATLD